MPDDAPSNKQPLLGGGGGGVRRVPLLLGCFLVLFSRYCIATFLSAFFTPLADGWGISAAFNGLIFAAYPFGMALTSLVAPPIIRHVGTRRAVAVGEGASL